MIEPQLSAEMERRFDEEFGFLASPIDGVVAGNYPLIKHFLATALEEQRVILQKVVSQQLLSTSLTARECEKIMNAVFPNGKE